MPRKRESWESLRAKQLQQEATDRRQRDAILASRAAEVVHKPDNLPDYDPDEAPPAEEAPEPFDEVAWQLNCRISSLMRSRFGPNWARHKAHHRLAERALLDLKGQGDGKALRNLRNSSGNSHFQVHWALMPGGPTQWHPGLPLTPRPY